MLKFLFVFAAVTTESAAYAQSAPHPQRSNPKTAPTVQAPDDPNDVAAVPRNVQKWFGGAVDDILSGADLDGKKR